MPDDTPPQSSILLYQTTDGRTRVECRLDADTIWLSQALIAELYQKDVRTVNEHLSNIFDEGEVSRAATIRKFRIVRLEGNREVSREVEHYSLPVILAVGYRVRSARGTQFRQWATARLSEYLVKGFAMDDERLKNPPGPGQIDYFDELLERIRDIRASERRVYLRVRGRTIEDWKSGDRQRNSAPDDPGFSKQLRVRKFDASPRFSDGVVLPWAAGGGGQWVRMAQFEGAYCRSRRRDESRRGTQECVRHNRA